MQTNVQGRNIQGVNSLFQRPTSALFLWHTKKYQLFIDTQYSTSHNCIIHFYVFYVTLYISLYTYLHNVHKLIDQMEYQLYTLFHLTYYRHSPLYTRSALVVLLLSTDFVESDTRV